MKEVGRDSLEALIVYLGDENIRPINIVAYKNLSAQEQKILKARLNESIFHKAEILENSIFTSLDAKIEVSNFLQQSQICDLELGKAESKSWIPSITKKSGGLELNCLEELKTNSRISFKTRILALKIEDLQYVCNSSHSASFENQLREFKQAEPQNFSVVYNHLKNLTNYSRYTPHNNLQNFANNLEAISEGRPIRARQATPEELEALREVDMANINLDLDFLNNSPNQSPQRSRSNSTTSTKSMSSNGSSR